MKLFTSSIVYSSSSLTIGILFLDTLTPPVVNFFPRTFADARGWSNWIQIEVFKRINSFDLPVVGWRGLTVAVRASVLPFFRSPLLADGGRFSS